MQLNLYLINVFPRGNESFTRLLFNYSFVIQDINYPYKF